MKTDLKGLILEPKAIDGEKVKNRYMECQHSLASRTIGKTENREKPETGYSGYIRNEMSRNWGLLV